MRAKVGDEIVVKGHHTGQPLRTCEVVEVHGHDGGPPYLVRWNGAEAGHEDLFFPGADAMVERRGRRSGRREA